MTTCPAVRLTAAAGLIASCAGLAVGAKYDPSALPGVTPRVVAAASAAGNLSATKAATKLYGPGGAYNAVTIHVPILLDRTDGFYNNAACEVVNGNLVVMNTTFDDIFPDTGDPAGWTEEDEKLQNHWGLALYNMVLTASTTSNNVLIDESIEFPGTGGNPAVAEGLISPFGPFSTGHRDWSNGMGSILTDGTALIRANFHSRRRSTQNNIEFMNISGAIPPAAVIPTGAGTKVFATGNGIDDTGAGSSFLSCPSAARLNNGNLLVAQSTFGSGAFKNGFNCWIYSGSLQNWTLPPYRWPNDNYPRISDVNGHYPTTTELRNTNHRVTKLARAGCSNETVYISFGEGSVTAVNTTPPNNHLFSGAGFGPKVFFIDSVDLGLAQNLNSFTNGYAFIAADSAAGIIPASGGDPERIGPIDQRYRFIEIQGTGSNGFAQHDINSKGQFVALWADFGNSLAPIYQIRLYNPIFDGADACKIIGYQSPIVIAQNGVNYGGTTFVTANSAFVQGTCPLQSLGTALEQPFSGVSIDDAGNISFVGTIASHEVVVNFVDCNQIPLGTAPTSRNTDTAMCFYDAATGSLYTTAVGGQNGDVLTGPGPSYKLGVMPTDAGSDQYGAEGMSETGLAMATSVRNGRDESNTDSNADGFNQDGGTLNPGIASETSARATVVIRMGAYTPPCACTRDLNGDCLVNTADLTLLLGNFGKSCPVHVPCPMVGDYNGDNTVNTADLTLLLGQFGCGS